MTEAIPSTTTDRGARPRTVLICHHDAPIDHDGLVRWLGTATDLVGVVRITEDPALLGRRARREISRTGYLRFLDVVAFRLYYRLRLASADALWEKEELARLAARYPKTPHVPVHDTSTPNSPETGAFLRSLSPDLVVARCKFLLKKEIFSIPPGGTLVLHPGICPEYRNAHGCFWALANDDTEKVGVTLLKVDAGVDTGPVLGYYSYPYDEIAESHIRIQLRCVTENLDALAEAFARIHAGTAPAIDTAGRPSAVWGQPWLTRYLLWKIRARRRTLARGLQARSAP
ncbi:MAG: formyltransferase family protein [Hyphomicrobiaceae bacterium]|nr:formyltransferase family protein [Hyphomicrobiaceae bacterium]